MRSKSQNKGQGSAALNADYINLLRDDTFDFYGIVAYTKLSFDQDKLLNQLLT